jgi:hypothetical protein
MDRGNRSPGPRTASNRKITYISLPRELFFLCETYASHKRITSVTLAIQTLLETHPALVTLANDLVQSEDSTSPL